MKQAIKKGTGIKPVTLEDKLAKLKAFKEKNGLGETKEKELSWLVLPEAFQNATKLPGIPLGYVSAVRGHSNTGKSTIKLEIIKAAQKQGIMPVIFELENNFAWEHAKEIGVEVSETVDPETGEILYGPSDNMLYYDTTKLFELYGCYDHDHGKMTTKPARETYVIEDVAMCIRDIIRQQREGELPFDLIFIIDSIGVGDCFQSAIKHTSNSMWFAKALQNSFDVIVNDLIPSSRNVNSEYINTLFMVQKIWLATTMTGAVSAKSKGGNSFTYATRLLFYVGGVEGPSIKALTATSGGREFMYGTKTKIKVEKNHVNNITYTGEICSLQQGIWDPNKLDEYKKQYATYIKQRLSETNKIPVDEIGDITYQETEVEDQ